MTNSTPEKTIRQILEHAVYDVERIASAEQVVNQSLADITRIIEECKPAPINHGSQLAELWNTAVKEFAHNLLERIG